MKQAIIKITLVLAIIFLIIKIGATMGTQPEDIQAFEDCILDQYDMSSTEYYSLTGTHPVCR